MYAIGSCRYSMLITHRYKHFKFEYVHVEKWLVVSIYVLQVNQNVTSLNSKKYSSGRTGFRKGN